MARGKVAVLNPKRIYGSFFKKNVYNLQRSEVEIKLHGLIKRTGQKWLCEWLEQVADGLYSAATVAFAMTNFV